MDCERFERTLDQLSSGTAAPGIRAAAEAHLRTCPGCRQLYGSGDPYEAMAPQPSGLLDSILKQTSGPACPAAARLLCDEFDGEPAPGLARMLDGHFSDCPACRELAASMRMLRQTLPRMAVANPGSEFTAAVLSATRNLRPQRRPKSEGNLWNRLVHRPLFAWEVAYAGTLLFALLFLNPVIPVGNVSLRALDSLHDSTVHTVLPAEAAARHALRTVADGIAERGSSAADVVEGWTDRAGAFLQGAIRDVRGRLRPGRVFSHRTFLRPLRLPGCETTLDANRGDPV